MTTWSVVVPTVGRACLTELMADLARQERQPEAVFVVDDRRQAAGPLPVDAVVLRSAGHGPAAARNVGWRAAKTEWVVFLDDDVRLPADWSDKLVADLLTTAQDTAGVQAHITVPQPVGRPSTDWERSTTGLERAKWATADMAYRWNVLRQLSGFDERFPRAYREDAEFALRVRRCGWKLTMGQRSILHPVRDESFWVSVRVQRGNGDDALLRAIYGRHWRTEAECPPGRFKWHLATVLAAALTFTRLRGLAAFVWCALTADFARRRLAGGPKTADEVLRMGATSTILPFAAVWHRARGSWKHRRSTSWPGPVRAVLFDRDGTLVRDVPYNGEPARVELVPDARRAVDRLRSAGLRLGVVSNQSGIGRGLITDGQVATVNRRIDDLLGPFSTWQICPHTSSDGCACRKPAPGLVLAAAAEFGLRPAQVVVIGDIGSDVAAAEAAGARSVLVPTPQTRPEEILEAPATAPDLQSAVDQVLSGLPGERR